jgi:NADH dehydrogenase
MPDPAPIATVFGGSGFVGRYIVQRLANEGWRVRVAVRRPNEALFVRSYGTVGQVEPIQANIRDDVTVRRAIEGADAVVNCVGILVAQGRQGFDSVQAEGAGRIARIAAHLRVRKLVQLSAIGADPQSESAYARSKAAGEAAVQSAFPTAVILRPSIVFGTDDQFFNRFASMARLSPVLPLVGPETRFQPVYVDDIAAAASRAVLGDVPPGIYELGGPEVLTFRELMRRMLDIIDRRRAIVTIPWPLARFQAAILDLGQRLTGGLFTNTLITKDQVKLLERDNVVSAGARGFSDLGIQPTAMQAVLESYLQVYRPQGQFTEITASAANLRQE